MKKSYGVAVMALSALLSSGAASADALGGAMPGHKDEKQRARLESMSELESRIASRVALLPSIGARALASGGGDFVKFENRLGLIDQELAKLIDDWELRQAAESELKRTDSLPAVEIEKGLAEIRGALAAYYGDNAGLYPKRLSELSPKYLKEIPLLKLPGHPPTNEVFDITSSDDALPTTRAALTKNTGKWVYIGDPKFNDPDSQLYWGSVFIDSTDRGPDGSAWSEW